MRFFTKRTMTARLLGAGMACAAGAAFATDGTWNWASTASPDGRSPEAAADWSAAANWIDGQVPSDSASTAFLVPGNQTTSMAGEGARYIEIPAAGIDLGEINVRQFATLYLTGGPVRFGLYSSQSAYNPRIRDEGTSCQTYYYCPIDFRRKDTTLNRAYFCGPVFYGQGNKFANSNYVRYYGNLWATNALTEVEGPMPNAFFSIGSGSVTYLPRMSAAAQTGTWRTFVGSRVLRRVGAQHDLAAGATVHGMGIPEGAYVARIYSNAAIELSEACTEASPAEGVTVTFDAFQNVRTVAHIKGFGNQGYNKEAADSINVHCLAKFRAEDVFDVYAESIDSHTMLDMPGYNNMLSWSQGAGTGVHRARVFLQRADVGTYYAQFGHVHLVFNPADGANFTMNAVGIAGQTTWNSYYGPIFETPAVVTARIGGVKRWSSALTKTGPGTLEITSGGEQNHFALSVSEGVMALSATNSAVRQMLNVLTVASGATFRLAKGALKIASPQTSVAAQLNLAAGAVLEAGEGAVLDLSGFASIPNGVVLKGPGTFVLQSVGMTAGATLAGTPIFRFLQQGTARDVVVDEPCTPEVVGHPAFWVDAAKNVTTTTREWTNSDNSATTYDNAVVCWRDCRAGETTYYATNDWTGIAVGANPVAPNRTGWASDKPIVEFNGLPYPGQSNYRFAWSGLPWNRAITNVCAVFSVYWAGSGGQAALGCTKRFAEMGSARTGNDFLRGVSANQGGGVGTWNNRILNNEAAACVRNGWTYVNGIETPYSYTVESNVVNYSSFVLIEHHPVAPYGRADAFAIQEHGGVSCSGCQKLAECIIYTNELTIAERRRVCEYLLAKYGNKSADAVITANRFTSASNLDALPADASVGLDVSAGKVEGLADFGARAEVVKTGAGTLCADYVHGTALDVRDGVLSVRSVELTESVIPAGHFVHLDAMDTSLMAFATATYPDGETRQMVRNWRPKDATTSVAAQRRTTDGRYLAPYLSHPAALGGRPVLDFGPLRNAGSDFKAVFMDFVTAESQDGASMSYAATTKIGSLFALIGSRNGGGVPFCDYDKAAWRSATADPSVPFFNSAAPAALRNGDGWIDGVKTNLTTVGLNGGYQVVSARTRDGVVSGRVQNVMCAAARTYSGGGELGEVLIYETRLDAYSHMLVDRYLNWKWLGIGFAGYRPSAAGAVRVAAGATLAVEGGAPLTVAGLSGAGTVTGSLKLAAGAELLVPIADDGSVETLTVDGSVDLSAGGTVRLVGDVRLLGIGRYRLVACTGATGGVWTVTGTGDVKRAFSLTVQADGIYLNVLEAGTLVIFRSGDVSHGAESGSRPAAAGDRRRRHPDVLAGRLRERFAHHGRGGLGRFAHGALPVLQQQAAGDGRGDPLRDRPHRGELLGHSRGACAVRGPS